jgi:N-acetylneuraminate synthase
MAAVSLGASLVEVHVTLSRDSFGPDVPVSLTPTELSQLVEGARFVYESLQHPVDKDLKSQEFAAIRETFSKSLTSASDLPAGKVIGWEDLAARKPGTGIPAADIDNVIGKRLKKAVSRDAFLAWNDFEEEGNHS